MSRHWSWLALAAWSAGCGSSPAPDASGKPVPEYNRETGKLERLVADRNGDGKPDTWARMDGLQAERIDIDQDGDGKPDRTEFYAKNAAPDGRPSVIERAEERSPTGGIVRREHYRDGVLDRVEEDTDGDGRMDKWDHYAEGSLVRLDLDVTGRGFPSRRLIYGAGGVRVEVDPDGDGTFEPAPPNGK